MAGGILVPQLGIEPISLALEGGLLTAGPPGKSLSTDFRSCFKCLPLRLSSLYRITLMMAEKGLGFIEGHGSINVSQNCCDCLGNYDKVSS